MQNLISNLKINLAEYYGVLATSENGTEKTFIIKGLKFPSHQYQRNFQ